MFDAADWSYHNPVRIECAPLETLAQHVSGQHVLLVTTPGFVKRGVAKRVQEILLQSKVTVWDGVKPNPDLQDIDVVTQQLQGLGVDTVVGLGGGSALDAAKILGLTLPSLAHPTLVKIFRDNVIPNWSPNLPVVAIPTTSGTGAEVTPFATIWDHTAHKKYSLSGSNVYPSLALLDPTLTLTLPEEETLNTGLDACSHALESLWNHNRSPVSIVFAMQALSGVVNALPRILLRPDDLSARARMQESSLLAGLAISHTRTAIAHGISYPVTSYLGIPHGLACSFTLPHLLDWSLPLLVADGLDEGLLNKVLAMLHSLRLDCRMAKYATPAQVLALQDSMVTKGRSENFRYALPDDLNALLSLSLKGVLG